MTTDENARLETERHDTLPAPPPKQARGFAAMSRERVRELASQGGRASHAQGKGHRWTTEEARAAGRKGGAAPRRNRTEKV